MNIKDVLFLFLLLQNDYLVSKCIPFYKNLIMEDKLKTQKRMYENYTNKT